MLRVLQIVVAPTATRDKKIGVGGPERRACNLIHKWRDYGIEPIVCYPRRGNLWNRFRSASVKLIDFEIGSKLNLLAALRIATLAREHAVQLIHTQGPPSLDMLACFGGRLAGVQVVITRPVIIEDQVTYSVLRRRLYSLVDRFTTLRMARQIIAVSKTGYAHLRDYCGVASERLLLIHNGIDPGQFPVYKHAENRGESSSQPIVIGMVGQLTHPKAWPEFLDVIDRLQRQSLNVLGLIVGEGELRSALEAEVEHRGLRARIEFTGFQEKVANAYKRMDIFLFTSHREGLSVAVIEALASELPIVATAAGGIREQVEDGSNGFVVELGDVDAMVRHCTWLIREPAIRASMGRKSRQVAEERFSEQRMLEQHVHCYRKLVGDSAIRSLKMAKGQRG